MVWWVSGFFSVNFLYSTVNLLENFLKNIKDNDLFTAKDRLLLAVSGGVDSVVLCELCKHAGYDFIIAHCNFQLRGADSDRDEQFVLNLAANYGVEFYSKTFDTKSIAAQQKRSIEETARDLRYEWFHELLAEHKLSCIVTAHHADDNIETMAMKFFRGTGIKGLRGMLPKNGKIVRPLLFARKKQLEDHARANQMGFVTDSTNLEDTYTRNFFRNRLIPLFKAVYPSVEENLLNNIDRFSETEQLYQQAIDLHKKKLIEQKGNEFHIPVLKLKRSTPLRSIVYEIISDFNFTANQAEEVMALLDSETGKYVASSTHRVIRNRKWLIITPLAEKEAGTILIEEGMSNVQCSMFNIQLSISDFQALTSNLQLSTSNAIALLDTGTIKYPLLLRKWKQGDYFYPLGMKKKKKLARFFIDNKLSKTEKEKVWVIESDKRIVWVVNHRIDERCKVTGNTKKVLKLSLLDNVSI